MRLRMCKGQMDFEMLYLYESEAEYVVDFNLAYLPFENNRFVGFMLLRALLTVGSKLRIC